MLLDDKIQRLEIAIVNHYTIEKNEKRLGWTKLKNLKVTLDYIVNDDDDWDHEYLKSLIKIADELKIPEGQRYSETKPKYVKSKKKVQK